MDSDNLVTLIEDHIPIYKLRAESKETSALKNLIKTPLLDKAYQLDLSPEFIFETLKYFIDCGERLTQMTRTYDDIDATTRLLEEKERDLELAARIGQSLLEENNRLNNRNDQLENDLLTANETIDKLNYELLTANELIVQLKYDLSNKNGLIQMYSELENEESESTKEDTKDKTSLLISWQSLHDKVVRLEDDNQRLRREAVVTCKEIELEEKKEILLIRDCAKQLTEANFKLINLQDELTKRSEDSITQQEEITSLLTQAVELQRTCRDLNAEKEGLEAALQLSNECQNELSSELIELKDKYDLLLRAFHELKEELKRNKNDSLRFLNYETDEDSLAPLHFIPISESLQAEIESTLESEGYGSEFSSLNTTHLNNFTPNGQINHFNSNQNLIDCPKSLSPDNLTDKSCESPNSRRTSSRCSNQDQSTMSQNSISTTVINKSFSIPNKLKIVKPFEGSETLGKWKKLATPHLGVILESHTGVQNRVLQGVDKDIVDYALKKDSPEDELIYNNKDGDKLNNKSKSEHKQQTNCITKVSLDNRFGVTSSVYTFTTTSLSQNKDITSVTPSLSNLQLATGQDLPITSISSSPISFKNTNSIVSSSQVNGNALIQTPSTPASSPTTEEPAPNLNFTNMISHFIRNTGSYFRMTKSNSSDKIQKESKMKPSSSLTNFTTLMENTKSMITLTESIAMNKVNDSKQVSAGLASLSNSHKNGGNGILMKGSLIRSKALSKDVVKNLLSSNPATRLEGFNALMLDVSSKLNECDNNKNIYIGKINCIRTLRKGGYF